MSKASARTSNMCDAVTPPADAACAVVDVQGLVCHGRGELEVEVDLDARFSRVAPTAVDLHDRKGRVFPIGTEFLHEILQVLQARVLIRKNLLC